MLITLAVLVSPATPAFAAPSEINAANTAWMMVATALVLMMTIPGLALFYSGMVRKKNVLATMAQSLAAVAIISVLWVAFGYSLSFVGDGPWLGNLDRVFLAGMTMDSVNPAAKTIPEALFMLYQMTFAIITVALTASPRAVWPSSPRIWRLLPARWSGAASNGGRGRSPPCSAWAPSPASAPSRPPPALSRHGTALSWAPLPAASATGPAPG